MCSKKALSLLLLLTSSTLSAQQSVIGFTSFEEPEVIAGQYEDTGDALVDHALASNPGEPVINYTSVGGELGFSSTYINTRNSVGLTDGDFTGVTDFTDTTVPFTSPPAYTDGTQGFQISDPDGLMRVEFDTLSLIFTDSPVIVSADVFLADTSWDVSATSPDDRARVWVEVDGGTELDLFNTAGSDIDDLGIEGEWFTYMLILEGYTTATLFFEFDADSAAEALFVDNISFSVVPVPAAVWLLGSGLLLFLGISRRQS